GAVTYEALSKFLGRLTSGRIMVVLSCREDVPADEPELFENLWTLLERRSREGQGREMSIRRIQLGPVDEAALAELVALLFHRSTPRKRIARALWNSSGGNPGLASEVLRELVRRGEAVPAGDDDGKLMLLVAPDDLPQPRSLDRLLAERLSVLAAEDRTWLERLAVLGGRIDPALLLLTGVAATHAELDPVLGRLVRLGWLLPIGNRYRFERPALRDAVYRGLSQGRRARLHLDIAHALEDAGSDSTDDAFTRAYHLRMAREDEELLAYLLPLIKRLRYRASAERLFTLSVWGLDALDVLASTPEHDTYRLTLLEDASDAADRLGRREAQRRLLDRLTDLELDPARMPLLAARVYLLHGRYAGSTGQLGLARGMFRNAREFAFAAHDDALISESTRRLAHVQGQVGELVAAQGLAERALLTATTPDQTALAELELAVFKLLDDRIEDALEGVDRAFAALRETDEVHHGIQAQAYLVRCRAWRAAGRPDRANAAIRRSLKLARRAGEGQLESEAHARLGVSLVDLDRAEEAEQELRDALLSSDEIEDRRGQVLGNVFLAMLLWEEDDVSARAGLVLAIRQATDVGFYRAEALARAILARLEHAHGNLAAADRESELSFTLMESHGSELGDRIAITGTRAMVLNSIQRGWESRSIVRALRRRMRQANRRLTDRSLQRNQRVYSTDLLEAVLSPEGHIFPRAKRSSVRDDSTFDDE
ncbi:MAG: tetratricopeptide (TPR) repeat protein, partial [Gammaproteobacteria bacterium]